MSRSGYSDDYEYGQLWQQTVENAVYGKRGQAFMRELVAALEEMPQKRLIAESLVLDGEVCALGAVGKKRGIDMRGLDPENPGAVAKKFNIAKCLAQDIVYENDEREFNETPEQRWVRIHAWAKKQLKEQKSA